MRTYVLDGIGSSQGRNSAVVTTIAGRLEERAGTTTRFIDWPAAMMSVGGSGSWKDNSNAAVQMIRDDLAQHDEQVILLAFSGGNLPVHDFLLRHPELHHRVAACGMVADPWRPRDRWQHGVGNPGGWGVCGERYTPIPEKVLWTTVPGDGISNAEPDSLLRHFADLSYGSPDRIVHDAIEAFQKNRFQLAAFLGLPLHEYVFGLGRRINEASAAVHRYLNGWHDAHYLGPIQTGPTDDRSLAIRLADSIAWAVRDKA